MPKLLELVSRASVPSYDVRKSWNRFWLVDGLDGMKEFLAGRDEYTVNIALIENQSPILGVIYAPRQRTAYFASKERRSWKMLDDEAPQRIHSVSKSKTTELVVVESRSHPSLALEKFLSEFRIAQRIKIGSSLKFCWLAEGRADLYARFGPTMEG